jgi:hypothetical protein
VQEAFWKTEIATNILFALEAIDSLGRDLVALLDRVAQRGRGQKEISAVSNLISVLEGLVILRNNLAAMLGILTAFRLTVSAEEVKAEEWEEVDWGKHILDKPDWLAVGSLTPFPSGVRSIERELQEVDKYINQDPALFSDFVVSRGESFAERFRWGVASRIAAIARIVGEKLREPLPSEMAPEYHQLEQNIEQVKGMVLLYLEKFAEIIETVLGKVMSAEKGTGAQHYFRGIAEDLKRAVEESNVPLLNEKMREIENFVKTVANRAADEERRNLIESVEGLKKKVNVLAAMIRQTTASMLTKFKLLRECFLKGI